MLTIDQQHQNYTIYRTSDHKLDQWRRKIFGDSRERRRPRPCFEALTVPAGMLFLQSILLAFQVLYIFQFRFPRINIALIKHFDASPYC